MNDNSPGFTSPGGKKHLQVRISSLHVSTLIDKLYWLIYMLSSPLYLKGLQLLHLTVKFSMEARFTQTVLLHEVFFSLTLFCVSRGTRTEGHWIREHVQMCL